MDTQSPTHKYQFTDNGRLVSESPDMASAMTAMETFMHEKFGLSDDLIAAHKVSFSVTVITQDPADGSSMANMITVGPCLINP